MSQTESNIILFTPDIDNVTKLPKNLNVNDINDLINILSEDNKKKLTLSLLNEEIKYGNQIQSYGTNDSRITQKITINIILHLFLRVYNNSFMIYPINLNIIHFILFNNLNINFYTLKNI